MWYVAFVIGAKLAAIHAAMKKEMSLGELSEITSMGALVGSEVEPPLGTGINDDNVNVWGFAANIW